MNEAQNLLVAEQMKHALDLMRADIEAIRAQAQHNQAMTSHRLTSLENCGQDHENRIRAATDGVTQFKMYSSLVSGGTFITAIAALLKSFLGAP
jgi:hypothetical protein